MPRKKKIKYGRKKHTKAELNKIYEKFWDIYDPEVCKISQTVKNRIECKHYSYDAIAQMIGGIEFFNREFGSENYRCQFAYYSVHGYSFSEHHSKTFFIRIIDLGGKMTGLYHIIKRNGKYIGEQLEGF